MSYGTDTHCTDEMKTGRLVSGTTLLAQALYRRLTTPRGTLDDGDEGIVYGIDLASFVGVSVTPDDLDSIPALVEAELTKDDRVGSLTATLTHMTDADGMTTAELSIDVFPADDTQAFNFTVEASAVTVALLGVTPL